MHTKLLITAFLFYLLAVVHAQQLVNYNAPQNMIAYYDRDGVTSPTGLCPAGWTELTAARGAALVGLKSGGTKGTIVGTALTNQQLVTHTHSMSHTHTLGAHTHTFSGTTSGPTGTVQVSDTGENHDANTSVHTHTYSGTSTAPTSDVTGASSAANTGTETPSAGTSITPYIQLLFCKKS